MQGNRKARKFVVVSRDGHPSFSRTWRAFDQSEDAKQCKKALEKANGIELKVVEQ